LDILNILNDLLTEQGYQVTSVDGSSDVFPSILSAMPDIIITDYILKEINGGEHCEQIKRDPSMSHVPVIILSGYSRLLESLGNFGADAVISKPFDNDELLSKVSELIH
jgi:two-component system, OmpR family, phosphate regulon response regulator PhoB